MGEVVGAVAGERRAEVGDRGEQRFDLARLRCVGAPGLEAVSFPFERASLSCDFFDARLCRGDDRVVGVVVFFEAKSLSAYGLVELGELPVDRGEFGCLVVVGGVERVRERVAEQV